MIHAPGRPRPQDPILAIASEPPDCDRADVEQLLENAYGLSGRLEPLVSERDQNFRLLIDDGRCFEVKIANVAEDPLVTDFQIRALLHLEAKQCPVPVPHLVATLDGRVSATIDAGEDRHVFRVVSYLSGTPLAGTHPDARIGFELGESLARIDLALSDFSHAGDQQDLLWDMQRASELRDLAAHVPDTRLRAVVTQCLDDFEANALPHFESLRRQVIHNDLNPGNVLVTGDERPAVAGVIDFGDMVCAPLIVDVAIAASYLRSDAAEPFAPAIALLAGFNSITLLDDLEISLLYDLIRTRLATTITIMHWRRSARADSDEYMQQALRSEGGSEGFLARINAVSRDDFCAKIRRRLTG